MLVTELTKSVISHRRTIREWIKEGFVRVSENGDPLWKFHRGEWYNKKINEVRIAPNGTELWIKIA